MYVHFTSKRIQRIIYRLTQERGEQSTEKVFKVLALWKERGWARAFGEYGKWSHKDYREHKDGFFISLISEKVEFQIVSSHPNADNHRRLYPKIPVIIALPGVRVEDLDSQMQEIFQISSTLN